MKKTAIKGLIALAVVVCLCMFFSGTIKTLSTAKVMIVTAKQGKLEEKIKLSGTLVFPETEDVALTGIGSQSVIARRVRAVKGKQVEEGDVLIEAEVVGAQERMDELRAQYDKAQSDLLALERQRGGARLTRLEEQWVAAYDALGEAKAAVRDARTELEVRARIAGVELEGDALPDGVKDKDVKAAAKALEDAKDAEAAAQQAYNGANRMGVSESLVEYITQSRSLSEQIAQAEQDLTALRVLCEQAGAIVAPHDGYVVEVNVKAGDPLADGVAAVVLSAKKSKGALRADVSDVERRIGEGTEVSMERSNGRSVSAEVTDTGVDSEGKNYVDVELSDREISNLGGAAALMSDPIEMAVSYRAPSSTTLLPVSAVRGSGEDRYVYLIQDEQNGLGESVMRVSRQKVTVLAEVGSTASIEEDLGRQRVAYMEDRAIDDGSEVMAYAQ